MASWPEAEAIAATARTLHVEALSAAADAVAAARVVDCCGIGASAVVALDLDHRLGRVGVVCRPRTEGHAALVSAAGLGPGDVLVAVSHSGRTADVVGAAREAAARGATVVALTSTAASPLTAVATHVLLAAGRETAYRAGSMASRTGSLLVVGAILVWAIEVGTATGWTVFGAAVAFILAMMMLIAALVAFMVEVRISLRAFRIRPELLEKMR